MKKNAFTNFIDNYKLFIEDVKKSENKLKMVIPNLLTFSRLLAPFFILPATIFGSFPLAVTFAALFALTDAFDGYLARKWNAVSEFGKNLDPICDKFFVLGIIIPFISDPKMFLTIILEATISLINLKSAFKNNKPKSTYLGKGKTVLLSTLLTLSYLFKMLGLTLETLFPLIVVTNTIQAITAIDYMHIDNKKDIIKNVNKIVNNEVNDKIEDIEQNSKIKQDLIEYKYIKESLLEQKENHKEIEKEKRKHLS